MQSLDKQPPSLPWRCTPSSSGQAFEELSTHTNVKRTPKRIKLFQMSLTVPQEKAQKYLQGNKCTVTKGKIHNFCNQIKHCQLCKEGKLYHTLKNDRKANQPSELTQN